MLNDGVAKLSPFTHEARRLSDDHGEGITAARHRDDAVDAAVRESTRLVSAWRRFRDAVVRHRYLGPTLS